MLYMQDVRIHFLRQLRHLALFVARRRSNKPFHPLLKLPRRRYLEWQSRPASTRVRPVLLLLHVLQQRVGQEQRPFPFAGLDGVRDAPKYQMKSGPCWGKNHRPMPRRNRTLPVGRTPVAMVHLCHLLRGRYVRLMSLKAIMLHPMQHALQSSPNRPRASIVLPTKTPNAPSP